PERRPSSREAVGGSVGLWRCASPKKAARLRSAHGLSAMWNEPSRTSRPSVSMRLATRSTYSSLGRSSGSSTRRRTISGAWICSWLTREVSSAANLLESTAEDWTRTFELNLLHATKGNPDLRPIHAHARWRGGRERGVDLRLETCPEGPVRRGKG